MNVGTLNLLELGFLTNLFIIKKLFLITRCYFSLLYTNQTDSQSNEFIIKKNDKNATITTLFKNVSYLYKHFVVNILNNNS